MYLSDFDSQANRVEPRATGFSIARPYKFCFAEERTGFLLEKEVKKTAVLLISCPDRKGLVATIANFLYQHNGNIIHADEHLDREMNLFLMRVEWDMADFKLNLEQFKKKFIPIAQDLNMNWQIFSANFKPKVAIFVSKQDHCLADLLYRYSSGELNCKISLIISNHNNAKSLANSHKIPFFNVSSNSREIAEEKSLKLLKKFKIDLTILARFMQILSPNFIKNYPNKIINIHHSFLPAFIGAKPYHQAFKRGVKIIGATSHFVTDELDMGPIIEQDVVRISHRDSVEDLIRKGKDLERMVLSRAVKWYIENRILLYSGKTVIFS